MGQWTAAVVFFKGPHVPYYIILQNVDFGCRPYRKSVQHCRTCANMGHRQDVCPKPIPDICYKCGKTGQPQDHDCKPTCKLCGEAHEIASTECRKRLNPSPLPYNIRQQRLNRIQERDNRWSSSNEEFPGLGTSATSSSSVSAGSSSRRSSSKPIMRSASRSRSRSHSRSVKRVSYADAVNSSSDSGGTSSLDAPAEAAVIRVLENKQQNQQSKLHKQHSQSQSQQNLIDKLLRSQQKQQELTDKLLRKCKEQQELTDKQHQKCQELENINRQPGTTLTKADVEAIVDAEIHVALSKLTRNTSPGKDWIVNKQLRNLPPQATEALLRYYNECWEKGELPAVWKHSDITMNPKPNKPLSLENPRPISLTSCAGKLFKHMVHDRITQYLEGNGHLPDTMFGFRQHLSTQGVL
ncbi:uncharacterized protein [Dermacentor albipictus]|uniref:uncharacterized protein n=1 Tax=Dermacentor albipictus TaxID=60249 RepID=UPI0031FBC686